MLVGIFLYGRKYPWYKYVSILMLCGGIFLFSFAKAGKAGKEIAMMTQVFGICLVGVNLFLDGYTNNQQDYIFKHYKVTSLQMMKSVNTWQVLYLVAYLLVGFAVWGGESELGRAHDLFAHCSALRMDILLFCICASAGQVFIFAVMQEFGSLTWVTLSITRKLVTIIVSVVMFNHAIGPAQWGGVAMVFGGMMLEVYMSYQEADKTAKNKKDK
jgi:solute carrier family 35 (UDP-galactose transporter), member B1